MSLQRVMGTYREFLSAAMPALEGSFNDDFNYIVDDWFQSNWEIIVEYHLIKTTGNLVILEPYGNGADCNTHSSRVWMPSYVATHRIMCKTECTKEILKFNSFVGFDEEGRYGNVSPFTHVQCNESIFIPFDQCDFVLEEINPQS